MKKRIFTIIAGTALVMAACNNAEEVKKQQDAENAAIQTLVDEKLGGLQEEVTKECDSIVLAQATAISDSLTAAAKKGGVKPKPKPKPQPKAEEPKEEPKTGNLGKKGDDKPAENLGKKTEQPAQNLGKKK